MKTIKIGITPEVFVKNRFLAGAAGRSRFSQVRINRGTYPLAGEELIEFFRDIDGGIIGRERISRDVLTRLPGLRAISKYGVGLDNIDFKACDDLGVTVLHTPGVNRRSVAELTLCYMLSLLRHIHDASRDLKQGLWMRPEGQQLSGKTVGIIGVGNIGKEVVNLLKPFDCRILVNDIIDQSAYYRENRLKECSKPDIFSRSDLVTIHTPLTDLTVNMVDRKRLKLMKPSAFLINTARGAIINRNDLGWALKNHVIAGAALDVFDVEPPTDREFLGLPTMICTPHLGGYAREAVEAMGMAALDNLAGFFRSIEGVSISEKNSKLNGNR